MWLREGIFYCMRVSSGDYFSKTNGPRSGATKYGVLNESKQMAYLNIFFEKSIIKKKTLIISK